MRFRLLSVLVVFALVAGACSDDESPESSTATEGQFDLGSETVPATFEVATHVETATVTGARPDAELTLLSPDGVRLIRQLPDELGQAHFALVPNEFLTVQTGPGTNVPTTDGNTLQPGMYRIVDESVSPPELSEEFQVFDVDDVPDPSTYDGIDLTADCADFGSDEVRTCYTYIPMRDGTTLSATVWLPDPTLYPSEDGTYPTIIDYSGYSSSNPGDRPPATALVQWFLGYAVVGVNMRGSGCSGGVFDIFNPAQHADGYDMVEVVARQDWVMHNHVGLSGLSYSGISQLFVASTNPPSLAAITPKSVIDDPWRQQWPGGIYNDGFTKQWLEQRDLENAAGGSNWVTDRADAGDETCAANLQLRNQSIDFENFAKALDTYPPAEDDRRISLLIEDIDVPVYLSGAWQDEQTGSRFAVMLDRFTNAPSLHVNLYNGHHPDGLVPYMVVSDFELLEFYVAKRIPSMHPAVRAFAPEVLQQEFGSTVNFPDDRFADYASYEEALVAYESEPPITVHFEFGWGDPENPGWQVPAYEATFDQWPPADPATRDFFLGPDRTLTADASADGGAERFQHDPDAGAATISEEGAGAYQQPLVESDWKPLVQGNGLEYLSAPLEDDTVLAAPGYVEVWVAPGAVDSNLEVNLSEVRPDGTEFRVQSGWLRLGHHLGIDPDFSTDEHIEYTYKPDDFVDLVPGEYIAVKVPIYPFVHPFRSGSQIRLTIETPGGNHPLWTFENPTYEGDVFHDIAFGGEMPSRIHLIELPDVEVTSEPPACPSLRGQVCRDYVAITNPPAD